MCAIDKLSGQEDLYGSSIAVAIRFLDHSLFTRLIPPYNYGETEFSRKNSVSWSGFFNADRAVIDSPVLLQDNHFSGSRRFGGCQLVEVGSRCHSFAFVVKAVPVCGARFSDVKSGVSEA